MIDFTLGAKGLHVMACQTGTMSRFTLTRNEAYERSCIALATSHVCNLYTEPASNAQNRRLCFKSALFPRESFRSTKNGWKISFALDTGGLASNDEQESVSDPGGPNLGGTRLGRIVSAGGRKLLGKLNEARKNFPMKVFLVLLGFYTANALATILGQTGDWDVLVAGVVVAAIEGIGMVMHRKPPSFSGERLRSLVGMVNFWKAGVCLGLFVDAFKLGS